MGLRLVSMYIKVHSLSFFLFFFNVYFLLPSPSSFFLAPALHYLFICLVRRIICSLIILFESKAIYFIIFESAAMTHDSATALLLAGIWNAVYPVKGAS